MSGRPIVQCVELSGTINDPNQATFPLAFGDWAVTVTVRVPAETGSQALERVDSAIGRAGIALLHGSKYKARRLNPKRQRRAVSR